MLGAAKPDALRAHFARLHRIVWSVRVGANAQTANSIGPFHERIVGRRKLRHHERDLPREHFAIVAVEGDPVALFYRMPFDRHAFCVVVNV